MKELRRTTLRLTAQYSLVFFSFVWLLSGGIYLWVDNSLGEGYVNRINNAIEQQNSTKTHQAEIPDSTAGIAADITLDNLRNILIAVNIVALIAIPLVAYWISKRSLQSLVASQEAQRRFIAHASHELRTPLAVMSGELELAAKQPRSIKEYQRTIHATYEEVQHMATLVRELLLLARVGHDGLTKIGMESVAVDALLEELIVSFQAKAKGKSIRIATPTTLMHVTTIKGNRELLLVALGNVLDNAIKFADSHSIVNINLSVTNHRAVVAIDNKGAVIDKDKLAHIFDRFYQTDVSHSAMGAGLGLSIAKQIVDLHHGSILANSNDERTIFTVTLPLASE